MGIYWLHFTFAIHQLCTLVHVGPEVSVSVLLRYFSSVFETRLLTGSADLADQLTQRTSCLHLPSTHSDLYCAASFFFFLTQILGIKLKYFTH